MFKNYAILPPNEFRYCRNPQKDRPWVKTRCMSHKPWKSVHGYHAACDMVMFYRNTLYITGQMVNIPFILQMYQYQTVGRAKGTGNCSSTTCHLTWFWPMTRVFLFSTWLHNFLYIPYCQNRN